MSSRAVLHVIDALNTGGAQELLALLAKFAPPGRSMAVCVLQPRQEYKSHIQAHGVKVHAFNRERPSIASPFRFLAYVLGSLRDIARVKKQIGADVVHCHLSDAEFLGVLAGRMTGARKVTMTFHTPMLLPERMWENGRDRRRANCNWLCEQRGRLYNKLRDWLRIQAMRLIYRHADAVVAVSVETLDALRDVIGLDPARLHRIVNGVDCDDLSSRTPSDELRRELGVKPGETVIFNLARLVPLKGQIDIIRAMALLADAHPALKLFIVGDGPEEESLAREIDRLGLAGRAFLLGPRSDAPDLLALADVVVVASLWEGTSLALMEAMAAGKPLAVTNIPGNIELIDNEVSALTFPASDPAAMAQAIGRLLTDRALGERLAQAAKARARKDFDIRRVVADYEALWV